MQLEYDNTLFLKQKEALEAVMFSNPQTEERIRKLIRREIRIARKAVNQSARGVLHNDPRDAFKAVRNSVYRRVLGGQINIYGSRRAGQRLDWNPRRKLDQNPHQRGGNRVLRSERTRQVDEYYGKDRGFILRFVNSGTGNRTAGTRGGSIGGNRGSIAARNWFAGAAQRELEAMSDRLGTMIEEECNKIFNEMQSF